MSGMSRLYISFSRCAQAPAIAITAIGVIEPVDFVRGASQRCGPTDNLLRVAVNDEIHNFLSGLFSTDTIRGPPCGGFVLFFTGVVGDRAGLVSGGLQLVCHGLVSLFKPLPCLVYPLPVSSGIFELCQLQPNSICSTHITLTSTDKFLCNDINNLKIENIYDGHDGQVECGCVRHFVRHLSAIVRHLSAICLNVYKRNQ